MFNGNTDSETVVYNKLPISIKTRFIRLLPMQWKNQIAIRIEVYGCPGIKLIMLGKIGLFYNRVNNFFLHKHSPLGNSLYLFSLCQALGQCRRAKKSGEQWKIMRTEDGGKREGKNPQGLCKYHGSPTPPPPPPPLHDKSFLVLRDWSLFITWGGRRRILGGITWFLGEQKGDQS